MNEGLLLPTSLIPAVSTNPKFLILYGRPKSGKTSSLAQLSNNLIIDLEGGSQFIDAMAVQARTVNDLGNIAQAIRAKNKEVGHNFYTHITIDNATRLEEMCLSYAKQLYVTMELYIEIHIENSVNCWNIFPISNVNMLENIIGKKISSIYETRNFK